MSSLVNFVTLFILMSIFPHLHTRILKRGLPEAAVVGRCPDDWRSKFCSCDVSEATLALTINCHDVDSADDLEEALRHDWDHTNSRFDWFLLENSNVNTIPNGALKELSFRGFIIDNNQLDKIDRFAFQGSEESADSVWLGNNKFGAEFNLKFLLPLRNLVSVTISSSNLASISTGAFGNLPHLEKIYLNQNRLKNLGKFSFSLLPSLQRIDLSQNNLTTIEKNMFNTSQTLSSIALILAHNQIHDVEKDAFADLKAYYVDLRDNKLTSLNQDAFEPLLDSMARKQHTTLQVKGNPFLCDSSFNWLAKKPLIYREIVTGCTCIEDNRVMNFAHNA